MKVVTKSPTKRAVESHVESGPGEVKGCVMMERNVKSGLLLSIALILMCPAGLAEESAAGRASVKDTEGTSIYADEEEPRVQRDVTWQLPKPVQREPQPPDLSGAERLLDPIDVEVFQTHRHFRQTLDILKVD